MKTKKSSNKILPSVSIEPLAQDSETTAEEVELLFQDSKSKNNNRSTKSLLTRFRAFLQLHQIL